MACKLVQREGVEQEEQQCRRRWTRMTAARGRRLAGGAGAEQGGASVARARARGGERARGLWRGGEAVQERRACGSGGATQEWRRRSGVRARGAGRRFRVRKKNSE